MAGRRPELCECPRCTSQRTAHTLGADPLPRLTWLSRVAHRFALITRRGMWAGIERPVCLATATPFSENWGPCDRGIPVSEKQLAPSEGATARPAADRGEGAAAVIFEALHDDLVPPERATFGAAGYDLRAYLRGRRVRVSTGEAEEERAVTDAGELDLEPGVTALIPLGFRARLPRGFEAQIRIRSSVAFRRGLMIPNAPGTIDSDYPDEWMVMLRNDSTRTVTLSHGERIAQAVLHRFSVLPWTEGAVAQTTDRKGGFGSTG